MNESSHLENHDAALIQQATKYFQQGDFQHAQNCVEKALDLNPEHLGGIQLLAMVKTQLGHYHAAEELFSSAIKLSPKSHTNYNNLGYVLHLMGRFEEARQACVRAIQLVPDFFTAYNTLAVILKDLRLSAEALVAVKKAINLNPNFIEAYHTHVAILAELGQFDKALPVCQHGLQLKPDYAEMHNFLIIIFMRLGRLEEASATCAKALQLRPDFCALYSTKGNLLFEQGLIQDALVTCKKVIEMNPDQAASHYNIANVLSNLGRFDEAEQYYRNALKLDPQHAVAHSNLLFLQASKAELPFNEMLKQQMQWDRVHGESGRMQALNMIFNEKNENERLRIGYVSADFCKHPVGYFIEPLLVAHKKSEVEIFCYANMYEMQADELTNRLYNVADHWRFVKEQSDIDLVKTIQQDQIDILIDLSGHTQGNRLKAFTYRPAPIQAMYLGYCASSGLQAMDYWITDEILHPPDTPELSSEKIVRLPCCSFSYQPPNEANTQPSRSSNRNEIVFASYSNFSKLLPSVIETWSEILLAVPSSMLSITDKYMIDNKTRDILLKQFKLNGISSDRLILCDHLSYADYYSSYSNIDIVLDPFPRTGGTTTADSLWMGVPLVTLAGDRYVERISMSKLHAADLDQFIAKDKIQYVEIARRLAEDDLYRRYLRKNMRERMKHSQLFDGKILASEMEKVYREMYARRWSD